MQENPEFPYHTLASGARQFGIELSETQIDQFRRLADLLIDWNTNRFNLTAIVNPEEIVIKHFLDSLSIVKAMDIAACRTMIDVGTGAGFPGIPLKIVYPNIQITMLDSVLKRLTFVDAAASELGLAGIFTVHARAEDAGHNKNYRERFDLAVSRAVAKLNVLVELCTPFCRLNGHFVSYKGGDAEDEITEAHRAIKVCGNALERTVKVTLPNSDIRRTLVVIKKIQHTPGIYPRKSGLPSKQPIV